MAPFDAALAAAELSATERLATVVLDAESGNHRLGLATQLADRLGARHLFLDRLDGESLDRAIRSEADRLPRAGAPT